MSFLKAEELLRKHCKSCEGGSLPLGLNQVQALLSSVPGWSLADDSDSIRKEYKFKNFKEVIAFFNKIAGVSEKENHHPDLKISYNRVNVELSTHAVKGLSENDFILAAKFDACRKA